MTTTTTTKKTETELEILPPNPFIFEILALASKQRSKAKKVEVLKTYEHDSLKSIFIWNFDETVLSVLPEGDIPYANLKEDFKVSGNLSDRVKQEVETMEHHSTTSMGTIQDRSGKTTLRKEFTMLYNFVRGGNDSLSSIRREMMFINMLEGLHPLEAEIVCLVKDKKLESKYKINKDIVSEAYSDIVWGNRG
jgi:hypothetical protein